MDVSEASIMVVHHAERFGLAQLHQLRGRVGRGERHSRCFLVTAGGPAARQRLDLLAREHSGLQIAEADLAHRSYLHRMLPPVVVLGAHVAVHGVSCSFWV